MTEPRPVSTGQEPRSDGPALSGTGPGRRAAAARDSGGRAGPVAAGLAERLTAAGLDPAAVTALVRAALAEDLAGGTDVTTAATIPAGALGTADLTARAAGVVAGLPVAEAVFAAAAAAAAAAAGSVASSGPAAANRPASAAGPATAMTRVTARAADGDRVTAGQVLATVTGPLAAILTAERTALNLLCHLSGVATLTRHWADEVAGTGAAIRDTRKTLPGLRALEKYAVRCGGGLNHRMSLSDAALVKDNHVAAAGSVAAAFTAVRRQAAGLPVEVECDTLGQVAQAVEAGAELILLDNFAVNRMREAVAMVAGRARLEASGGLSLAAAREVALTGVDFLSVGALTHSAPALDIGLDLVRAEPGGGSTHAAGY